MMPWPHPWGPLDESTSDLAFEAELQRELSPGHPLFGLPLKAIGRRGDNDDVLFAVEDGTGRVTAVHLTWRRSPELPPWPASVLFDSPDEWARDVRAEEVE